MTEDRTEIVRALARPMFTQGADLLYVTECCGRLYVGLTAPAKCAEDAEHVLDVRELRPGDL